MVASQETTQITNISTTTTFLSKLKNIGILLLGGGILALHVILYNWSVHLFNLFMCLYILGTSIFITVEVYRYQSCYANSGTAGTRSFNMVTYLSLYTAFLEVIMFVMIIILSIRDKFRPKARSAY